MGGAGNSVVYVPMIGTSSPQGVIEIHGMLCTADSGASVDTSATSVSEGRAYQRSPNALRAMIQAKDYK